MKVQAALFHVTFMFISDSTLQTGLFPHLLPVLLSFPLQGGKWLLWLSYRQVPSHTCQWAVTIGFTGKLGCACVCSQPPGLKLEASQKRLAQSLAAFSSSFIVVQQLCLRWWGKTDMVPAFVELCV